MERKYLTQNLIEMADVLFFIEASAFLFLLVLWILIWRKFLQINANLNGRKYEGLFSEWLTLDPIGWFQGKYIEIFPISLIVRLINPTFLKESNEHIKKMYESKIRLEYLFWVTFIFIIVFSVVRS